MGWWGRLAGRLDRDDFVAEAMVIVRKATTTPVSYDASEFAIRAAGMSLYLANYWTDYLRQSTRVGRAAVLERMGALVRESSRRMPADLDKARPHLVARVHDESRLSLLRLTHDGIGAQERSIGAHLRVSLWLDRDASFLAIESEQLESWGLSFEEAIDEGLRNLGRMSHARWPEERPGILRAPFEDGNAAGRAALPHVVRQLVVKGEPVGMVLGPSQLVVTGSEDDAGLVGLAEVAEQAAVGLPGALPAFLVRLQGDAWVEHVLPVDHPAAGRVAALRRDWLVHLYRVQADALRRHVGEDLHLAACVPTDGPDRPSTLAGLGLDFVSLVPAADFVVVNRVHAPDDVETIAAVRREDAERILHLREEPGLAPRRWRFHGAATEAQVAALRSASILDR